MLAKRTSKNQITLPKEIVRVFGDVEYFDVSVTDNVIRLTPVTISPVGSVLQSVREKMKRLGVTQEEVGRAVRWARNRKR